MGIRPLPVRTRRSVVEIGEHLSTWRKLQGLTIQQIADRAGVTRQTLARLEKGDPSVSIGTVMNVTNALGQLSRVVESFDPYETAIGRARSEETLPQRVRR
jgi:transcriptional regulator with XRE-family HTH domain